jgi:polyisoprenoid-binding protein YceI
VTNLGFIKVDGSVPIEAATLRVAESGEQVEVHARMRASGFSTGSERRDAHLREPRFLDTEQYPDITFTSTTLAPAGDGWRVDGTLTLKGRSTPITLRTVSVEFDDSSARVRAVGQVDRHQVGLTYGPNFAIGRIATVRLDVQLTHGAE